MVLHRGMLPLLLLLLLLLLLRLLAPSREPRYTSLGHPPSCALFSPTVSVAGELISNYQQ